MLRIYFLQQWFNLSDPQAEDAIYDSESMRRFARVELGADKVPDESTILRFRHLLEKHGLTEGIFEAVKDLLTEQRLLLRAGTIVDATIIAAPSSTKNATRSRDPEMKQTRKGGNWYFGMKFHIGTDRRGTVHSLTATHAAESDIKQLPNLLHGEESVLYGDQAYWKEADRQAFEAKGVRYRVNRRVPGGSKKLSERWRKINRARSRTRACCEHPFRIVKQLWASIRRATAASPRTGPAHRRCSRSPTSTLTATSSCHRGRGASCDRSIDAKATLDVQTGRGQTPNLDPLSVHGPSRAPCAELP